MQFFDSHCHLDRIEPDEFAGGLQTIIEQSREQGVEEMLCVCVNLESYDSMYQSIEEFDGIYASVGVHPDHEKVTEPTVEQLIDLSDRVKTVAIGETGLDYVHTDGPEWQKNRFRIHIDAALAVNKPLIIHTRNAKQDTLDILRAHKAEAVGGVLHCFTEDWEMAKQAIEMDFYISISGIVTFKQAENVREMAKQIPLDRLLIETDSPWLAPVPHRGKTNYPGHVPLVAQKLAEIRNESVETLAMATAENARKLFALT